MAVLLAAILFWTASPFVPQTPPPTPTPYATLYPGEDCVGYSGSRHAGPVWYCRMPDPNPNKQFDTSDCFQHAAGVTDKDSTYCSTGIALMGGENEDFKGLPAWMWLLLGVIFLLVGAKYFGPKSGGWRKTNVPGVMARDPSNKDAKH